MARSAFRLMRFEPVDAFAHRALPFLLEREAEHGLLIGSGQIYQKLGYRPVVDVGQWRLD